ncbi:aspartate aminotransferase family protein [Paramaledivibacter caminithermalis]|uniref:Adenosylmethionine-8-amino-7-oxononanoate aminotransferase n=1 Tax=Paramaledivibacter caminithermalis (strain DSM 15212 / CIP 107654 / DViRD3) TaxID=1121301 RepID=A0A1M6Q8D1_PARC5|nr:aspartate aminotransferase family protein [Paramaledivibacter caminithermalis]SHK16343.1 Adenosylmethionine-8-amino-7-oxononanoate aminotransferase [Paramaledivibacter caminithermalis DSM 15212]
MSLNKAPKNHVFYRNQNWSYPKIERGEGIYLIDEKGKKYIDGCSGSAVANIGHGNKEIAEFTKNHMERIAFTHLSRWTVDSIEKCAEKVVQWAPGDLNHVYFVSGGSESTETAIKLARQYFIERDGNTTTKWKVISKWNSFHGNTMGALSMTGITGRRKIYDPMLISFPKIPQFYHYRNPWDCKTLEETSIRAAEALEAEILRHGPHNIAAFITEPVIGSAAPGVHPDKIYFEMVRKICDKYDVLLIVDEVMAGFGRTGKKFAVEHFSVVPDIITCAKGMSCGYTPIGAAVVTDEIFNTIMVEGSGHFIHGHTYAGNPLSCGIASKVIEIIEREGYVKNAENQGEYLMDKLQKLYDYDIVGDIRGKGLMIGIEFVKDKEAKKPFEISIELKNKITVNCLDAGLVVYPGGGSVDGVRGDHILIAPPINITKEEVDLLFDALDTGIKKTCEQVR